MLPGIQFSTESQPAAFLYPANLRGYAARVAYSIGGVALGDISKGIRHQLWRVYYVPETLEVRLTNESGFDQAMFKAYKVTELSLAFDFSMRAQIAYTENGQTWLRQFNLAGDESIKRAIPNATFPRLTLDDKRQEQAGTADVLLFYLRAGNICCRIQRESFLTEHILAREVEDTRLGRVGMTTGWRVQVEALP